MGKLMDLVQEILYLTKLILHLVEVYDVYTMPGIGEKSLLRRVLLHKAG